MISEKSRIPLDSGGQCYGLGTRWKIKEERQGEAKASIAIGFSSTYNADQRNPISP